MRVNDVQAAQLGRQLGISEAICRMFLAEARERMPTAYLSIIHHHRANIMYTPAGTDIPIVAYLLERMRDGYVRVASDALTSWELIPESGIVDRSAANRAIDLYGAKIVPDSSLARHMRQRLGSLYRRYRIPE